MGWNNRIRTFHPWTSIVFTLAVMLNFAAVGLGSQKIWIGLLALFPLFLLLFSGLYLFALPYVSKWRGPPQAA